MADRKISDLTALTTPASGDYLPIVDISEAAAASKNKRITIEELFRGVPLGTAAAPSIAIEGDEDTGIYSPSADQLSIATNGTERLRIDSTGQIEAVSLGTAAAPTFSFTGDPNTGIYSPGADQVAVATNGTGRLFIDASGNVGVGTSPASTFHVAGTGRFVAQQSLILNGTTGTYATWFYNGTAIGDIGTGNNIFSGGPTDALGISPRSTGALILGTNSTERLRIDSSGRVGIGTTSPSAQLTVVPPGVGGILVSTPGGAASYIESASNGSTVRARIQSNLFDSFVGTLSNHPLYFQTNGTERARFDTSGRFLVGTSSDSGGALLQVNGDRIRVGTAKTPATSGATGTTGEIAWDANYIYVCIATNTWKRSAIATW